VKANFKIGNGRLTFEVQGEKAKDVWAQVAQIEELFCAETACGLCQSTDLRYGHRVAMKGTKPCHYYELVCRDCGAQFGFGQRQDTGELFPKRKHHETKAALPNGGWRKWGEQSTDPDEGDYYDAPQAPQHVDRTQPPPQHVQPPAAQRQPAPQQTQPPPQQTQPAPAQRQPRPAGTMHTPADIPAEAWGDPPPPRRSR
jgi:hypothetical protein